MLSQQAFITWKSKVTIEIQIVSKNYIATILRELRCNLLDIKNDIRARSPNSITSQKNAKQSKTELVLLQKFNIFNKASK